MSGQRASDKTTPRDPNAKVTTNAMDRRDAEAQTHIDHFLPLRLPVFAVK